MDKAKLYVACIADPKGREREFVFSSTHRAGSIENYEDAKEQGKYVLGNEKDKLKVKWTMPKV